MTIKKITNDELWEKLPKWCEPGRLVWVDADYLEVEKDKIGIVLNSWILDVEQADEEEYNDMILYDEWFILDVLVDNHVEEQLYSYALIEFKKE